MKGDSMFCVKSIVDESALAPTMEAMRTWLDHRHFCPATFRYRFASAGVVFSVEFSLETEASDFAKAFGGKIEAAPPDVVAA
jgi:hypothetical protein